MDILLTWVLFMLLFLALGYILGARNRSATRRQAQSPASPMISAEMLANFQQRVMPVLAVAGHQTRDGGVLFDGKLRTDPQSALSQLTRAFAPDKLTPILREGEGDDQVKVALIPGISELAGQPAAAERPRWGLHWLLFALTLVTTTWAGALHAGVDLLKEPTRVAIGFALQFRVDADPRCARTWPLLRGQAAWHSGDSALFHPGAVRPRHLRRVHQTQIARAGSARQF